MDIPQKPTVYFSNQLEVLGRALQKELFVLGADPFEERWVLLPHHSVKRYLSSLFISSSQISAGVFFKPLLEGVRALCGSSSFLSSLGLSFLIERELYQIVEEGPEGFEELQEYLQAGSLHKKIDRLSQELGRLFYEYSTVEASFASRWLTCQGWQQKLWVRLFTKEKSPLFIEASKMTKRKVHLFGFSHLPSYLMDFFGQTDAKFYVLSPSEMFLEDLCSDQERVFLDKKMNGKKVCLQVKEQLDVLLKQAHPLLANWGKAGRSLLRALGELECYVKEEYVSSSSCRLLHRIQRDLLFMEEEGIKPLPEDDSLQVVSSTSKLREVEVLLESLQGILLKHPKVEPKDILVLSCDLEGYLPYIHMVFGAQEVKMDYSVHGLSLLASSEDAQAMASFFDLVQERFAREAVLRFLSFPCVMKKFSLTLEDLSLLDRWTKRAHIFWGLDAQHKQACLSSLSEEETFERGSWKEGIERLLKGLAIDPEREQAFKEPLSSPWPLSVVEGTDLGLLQTLLQVVAYFREDFSVVYEEKKLSFYEWQVFLQRCMERYFAPSNAAESLLKEVQSLVSELGEDVFSITISFSSFQKVLQRFFQKKKESFQSGSFNAITFSSLEEAGATPCEVLVVLGCDESAFPREARRSSLEEFSAKKESPSLPEKDRYLLLELLLHAKTALLLSYQRVSWKDQKAQGPSLLIEELLSYLDQKFMTISGKKPSEAVVIHHPVLPFDKSYFMQESRVQGFSKGFFSLAQKYYHEEKKPIVPFFLSWKEAAFSNKKPYSLEPFLDLHKIQEFAKNPIRHYLKERGGMFFDALAFQDPEFFLSPAHFFRIQREALQGSLEEAATLARRRGELPPLQGFEELSFQELQKSLEGKKQKLHQMGIHQEDLFSIELSEQVDRIEKEPTKIWVPALSVGGYLIKGQLYPVCCKGLLWMGGTTPEDRPLLWPSFLVFSCLAEELKMPKECLFVEGVRNKQLNVAIKHPKELLERYIKLYERSLQDPCPLLPQWAWLFSSKEVSSWDERLQSSLYSVSDPFIKWVLKRDALPLGSWMLKQWQSHWKEVFSPLFAGGQDEDV